jgi:alkylation response protein AidB-like acyl-CoA dehydrogenase
MGIGITDEHSALAESARGALARHCPPAVPRALLDAEEESLPAFWSAVTEWLGLHVDEDFGGSGAGLPELAVVIEELGRACAPGPFVPSVLAAALIARGGSEEQRKRWLPGLADGSIVGAVAFAGLDTVVGGGLASLLVVPNDGAWYVTESFTATPVPSLDPTRRLAAVSVGSLDERLEVGEDDPKLLAALLFAAEACGVAGWCLDTATEYAKVRVQFGRPIGQFQAIKHRLADLLLAVEQSRAAVWDAVRADITTDEGKLAVGVAAALAFETVATAGKDCVQIHGGIGYTWEHDAHIYLKRAMSLRALCGDARAWQADVARHAFAGVRRNLDVSLPEEAEAHRVEVRAFLDSLTSLSDDEKHWRIVDEGYLVPHYPKPYGRDADALEQLVIDEEFRRAKVRRPSIAVGGWALPTLIAHGTAEQQERWIGPTLRGQLTWCQMFSEPGAGSDLAALSTRAERVEGGWQVNGQKVWTSLAQHASHAILLARTASASGAERRSGITYFILDMKTPGIDVRPLRELTGLAMFNEVFLNDVFIPDDCVVGDVGDGWRLARTTLANERVQMGTGSSFGRGVESLVKKVGSTTLASDPVVVDTIGALVTEAQSLAILTLRTTLRALSGAEPGSESSLKKLLGVEHDQRVQEYGLQLLGPAGATTDGEAELWTSAFLATRCLTIAGGTSEVQRNVIAERLLGLPRDAD